MLRGLLGMYTIEQVTEIRAECPGEDLGAVLECLEKHPLVGPVVEEFAKVTNELVKDAANDITAAGGVVSESEL